MADFFPDGFSGARERIEEQSDRALYKYLQIHICGPYTNDCHPYLSEIKYLLQEEGFERAKLCTDRPETTPSHLDKDSLTDQEEQELREFWTKVSYKFLKNADVAVFFFFSIQLIKGPRSPIEPSEIKKVPTTTLMDNTN